MFFSEGVNGVHSHSSATEEEGGRFFDFGLNFLSVVVWYIK